MSELSPLMRLAQPGLFAEPNTHSHYLEYSWPAHLTWPELRPALQQALQPVAGVHISLAFGAAAWQRCQPTFTPAHLQAFTSLIGINGHQMPATQGDIWFWIHGTDRGEVMTALLQVEQALAHLLVINLDISGFKNRESRDLTGFVDGTENPQEQERGPVAQIALDAVGAGGSYVFTQQWQHDLHSFNRLNLTQQEQVFGRSKQDDIEMDAEVMPANAHVSRTDVELEGEAQEIYRRSTPYGTAQQHGLYFIACACHPQRIGVQLENMLGLRDGISDRMLDFTQAVTGAYWFLPAQQDLDQLLAKD